MFGSDNESSATLKTLADTLADSVNGYRDAAEHVDNSQYKELFVSLADQRDRALRDLNKLLYAEGADPDRDGTTLGHLHQRWLDFKASITGRDDKAVINEVERGEDYLKEKFEAALKLDSLEGEARFAIENAYNSVREGHDRVSALKRSLEERASH